MGKGSLLAYLVHMTLRIAEIYRVLKPTGSFYLHCDPTASHYLKLLIDSIFCSRKGEFLNEIVWKRTAAHSSSNKYGPVHDVILYYSKTSEFIWNKLYQPYDQDYLDLFFDQTDENGKKYQRVDLTGAGTTKGESGMPWRNIDVTPKGRHWAYNHKQLDEWDKNNKIHWPKKTKGMPRLKVYPEDKKGIVLQDIWNDIKPLHNLSAERLGYPTQKPELLLQRIIKASSNEGDVVLDAYCGCGTAVIVAQNLKRKWIGVDITYQSISLILKRLEETFGKDVIENIQLNGIPKDMESAIALANKKDDRTRKEFEKWAILSYSNNKALINEKKGADHGIDGIAYIMEGHDTFRDVLFSVKSGHSSLSQFRDFCHVVKRDEAAMGIFITLDEPTKQMNAEAVKMGKYVNPLTEQTYDKVSLVTIQQMLVGEKLDIPTSINVLKKADLKRNNNQSKLDF